MAFSAHNESARYNFVTHFHLHLHDNEQIVVTFTVSPIRRLILKAVLLQRRNFTLSTWKESRSCTAREGNQVTINLNSTEGHRYSVKLFFSAKALSVSTVYNANVRSTPSKFNMNVVFVAPILHDNLQVELVGEMVESAHSHDRMGEATIWLLGMENPDNVDETSLIKDTFTGLALTFDGDVFIYIADGDVLRLYEVYKISDDDEGMIVLPLGHWSDTARKLVMSEVNKHERRRDLKASTQCWAVSWAKGFVNIFLRVPLAWPLALGNYCSCHAAQAEQGELSEKCL